MNTISFETLENTTLSAYLKSKNISEMLKQEWYNTILENKNLLEGKDFKGISEIVESLAIKGIDGDIVNMTVCTIASDNNIEIDPELAKCFMMFSKNK